MSYSSSNTLTHKGVLTLTSHLRRLKVTSSREMSSLKNWLWMRNYSRHLYLMKGQTTDFHLKGNLRIKKLSNTVSSLSRDLLHSLESLTQERTLTQRQRSRTVTYNRQLSWWRTHNWTHLITRACSTLIGCSMHFLVVLKVYCHLQVSEPGHLTLQSINISTDRCRWNLSRQSSWQSIDFCSKHTIGRESTHLEIPMRSYLIKREGKVQPNCNRFSRRKA